MRRAGCLVLVLAACAERPPPPPDPGTLRLTPVQRLIRASAVLRGIRPSLRDLQAVDADPTTLDSIVQGYLSTPEFARTVREMHDEALMVRVQLANYAFPPVGSL